MENNTKTYQTPILLIVFNRLDTTKKVFEVIREARPFCLYIASDGPRAHINGEKEKVLEVREYLKSAIDWNCNVKTLYRKENLGCKNAVSSAIDWLFDTEEMGIILEDDCLPNVTFFRYCEELLVKYKCDNRIFGICGSNLLNASVRKYSYFFSKYFFCWGWATWKRAWKYNKLNINELEPLFDKDYYNSLYINKSERKYFRKIIDVLEKAKLDTWDYQYFFSGLVQNGLYVIPERNLISNIGCGECATHSRKKSRYCNLELFEFEKIMVHPDFVLPNYRIECLFQKNLFSNSSLFERMIKKREYFIKAKY